MTSLGRTMLAPRLSTGTALNAEDARCLTAALDKTDAALAELEQVLGAAQARGEAPLEASIRQKESEAVG